MPTAIQPDVAVDAGSDHREGAVPPDRPDGRRHGAAVRIACHLAAEVPLVVLCLRSMATGWRATSDDAVAAWRAWDVLSAHPTLLGAPTHTTGSGHQAFAPGPVLSWLLAVPVHLDPAQGALWGSTLIALAAVALGVEAAWAAGGRWGAAWGSAAALAVLTSETAVLLNPTWTPWQGALWLVAALAAAWATATGRWRWWPACVVAASVAAQAHVVFALTALAACAVSPLVALATARFQVRDGRRIGSGGSATAKRAHPARRPLVAGVLTGTLLWLPPALDQLAGRPGNLTLLWRSSQAAGGRVGYATALQGLGAATWPPFSWAHRLPTAGADRFFAIVGTTFHGPSWHGVATLVALVGLGSWCTLTGRGSPGALAWVAAVAGAASVATIAQTPSTDGFELIYLGVLFWPVGLAATGAIVAGVGALVRAAVGSRVGAAAIARTGDVALAVAVAGLVALAVGVTVVDAAAVPDSLSVQGGPSIAVLADRGADAAARVAPAGPFELRLSGTGSVARTSAVYPAIAYELVTRGVPVRLPFAFAVGVDAGRAASGDLPVVTVDVATQHPTATATPPAARRPPSP